MTTTTEGHRYTLKPGTARHDLAINLCQLDLLTDRKHIVSSGWGAGGYQLFVENPLPEPALAGQTKPRFGRYAATDFAPSGLIGDTAKEAAAFIAGLIAGLKR